ncbi:CPBP family intramembrane metalloprotease [Rhodococcus sp. G-MC3]|uniref:CPBP family intramembrane glutamic endopeptidase n=1 Tax=Rhodococcus sp. G-MC3 TaxID=3046209 RepID=UPI0024BAB2BE|nr:CPBP family intramembrane glutamic endopeptidase [Rhodococcus sp. G-MC3]MDJ0394137.1 CPBP family intramembrane metalloprotease [Rhodococcus sp. G-MC3]
MQDRTMLFSRPDGASRPNLLVTVGLVILLVSAWLTVYSISVLGAVWRSSHLDAPTPILSVGDQRADLVVAGIQLTTGLIAIVVVLRVRRLSLRHELPERSGTALGAAVAWCAAIAASSALVLALDRVGAAGFDISAPAVVESDWLAVVSALSAGLREEPLLAALPVLLLAGRIPLGWIMVLAGAMRGVMYLYFGSGGFLWAFCWGAAAVWVYYTYRRLWVLVLVHGLVMNLQALDRLFAQDSAATVLQWANILILFGALTWWLVPRALDSVLPGDKDTDRTTWLAPTDTVPVDPVEDGAAPSELPLVPPASNA